ncbi:hypothetical protein ACGF7U_31125 [Micromonospora sp. NPDC047670]|uniref:hypothetical protein n=1 Tax=Micromonospora sp. NPDC047670 TaxID=3364252 RepID=UPI00371FE0A2
MSHFSGDLITWLPGSYVKYNNATSKPQDLSYDRHTRWLWNMFETPRKRLVYARSIDQLA